MTVKKHTLTTLAMALSVLLASCSSNSGNNDYHNNTITTNGAVSSTKANSSDNASNKDSNKESDSSSKDSNNSNKDSNNTNNSNKDYTVDTSSVELPVKDINNIKTLSFNNANPYNIGYRLLSATDLPPFPTNVFFNDGDYSEVGDSIPKTDEDISRASLSFNGVSDYNTLKTLWGTPIAGINPATALLPSYSIGLGTVLGNNSKNFIPTIISQQSAPVNDNNYDYKTDITNGKVINSYLSSDHAFTGEGINIGLVSNSFKITTTNNTTFTNPIKTVDIDSKATVEHQTEVASKHNLGYLHTNAFITGALITGNRNYQANGLVPNAQLYVSTINVDDIIAKKFPQDVFVNLYNASHPIAIISDGVNTGLYSRPDEPSTQDNLINSTNQAISKLQQAATNDQPLLILPTSEYNLENPTDGTGSSGNPYTRLVSHGEDDNGNQVEGKGSSRVDENDGLNKLYNEYILDTNGYPILLVNGAYFDPKGIYTEAQQKYKVKIINHRDIDATKDSPSSDEAKKDLVTNFKGQPITTDGISQYTVNHRSNFVNAYGMLSCAEAAYFCLTAPADYTSNLINRPNTAKNSSNIADLIFPVSDTDQRFKHTDFSSTYAAARVAGAAVILKQQFPWFSAQNLRVTLLTTATPIGPYRISSEYGWGVLNIDNALAGPSQFIFGDFYVDFTNVGTNNFRNLVNYDNKHKTRSNYNYRSYFTHNISGAGGLFVTGRKDDYLILTGANTYTGHTYVYDTNLVVAKPQNFSTPATSTSSSTTKVSVNAEAAANTGAVGLLKSSVFISPNATLTGVNATFGERIVNDGIANFKDSIIACSISGEGTISITGGYVGQKPSSSSNYCEDTDSFEGIDNADVQNGATGSTKLVINLGSSLAEPGHEGSLTLNQTEVFGNVLADLPKVKIVNTTIHGNLSTYNPKVLEKDEYKFTDLTLVNSTVTDNMVVAGNTTIIDSHIGSISDQVTTLDENMTVVNSTFDNLVIPMNSTFYFDPSAQTSYVKEKLTLGGKVEAIAKDKQIHKDFVPTNGKTYSLFKAHTIIGNFDSVEVDSSQKLIGYSVEVQDNSGDSNYKQVLVAKAHPVKAKEVIHDIEDGYSPSDSNLMTASAPVADSIIAKANTAYDHKNNHLALSASDSNTLALASDLQYYNAAELRSFLVKASAPIYSDTITANAITLNDQYLDFSRKVNANYFNSPDQGKVKAYLSYSFLNNFWNTEFDQAGNSTTSVAGAHSYSTNLKGKQVSNGISAGAYGQFGYYNVGLGVNYLRNSWNEYYADYANVVASQQDLLHNLGQATINTASLMLSASKTTGNYFLGTSIFGNWQGYDVSRSSLAKQDQTAKFNVYGVTVNFNTGFKHLISTHSGFSGQASVAYNYNYHTKFNETASSDLAKVLSYDVKAQGTSLAYANFRAEYFYNFKLFNLDQGINLALGYTLNLFDNANQTITNSVTGVSLHTSNAFTGGNANLLKFGASYHLTLVKDLDLDLNASYYTNRYWNGYKGQATLTYSF